MENNVVRMGQRRNFLPRELATKKMFDSEYMTEWLREVRWLEEHDFKPDYVRTTRNGINMYKYKKTPELFTALAEFYTEVRDNKPEYAPDEEVEKALKAAGFAIRRGRGGRISFVKDNGNKPAEAQDDTE